MRSARKLGEMDAVAKIIQQRIAAQPVRYEIGRRREELCAKALALLKKKRVIADYIPTGPVSYHRVKGGIDFYLAVIKGHRYVSIPLAVTRPAFLREQREKHPEAHFIGVSLDDSREEVARKILEILGP